MLYNVLDTNPSDHLLTDESRPDRSSSDAERESLIERLGIVIVSASADVVEGRMPVSGNRQHVGFVHGGALCALAETLGSLGAILHAGEGHTAYGIDINATHHRSTSVGMITGVARAVSLGRTLCSHEVIMTDDLGRRVSTARITNIIRRQPV